MKEQRLINLFRTQSSGGKLVSGCLNGHGTDATVGLDFSSPNIAKPFHIGHLRSTFLGRFLSNMYEESGYKVVRINYVGDIGTQFGLLASEARKSTVSTPVNIRNLYSSYVNANQLQALDPSINLTARDFCHLLETGDRDAVQFWSDVRQCGLTYLERIYDSLNVKFDVWQSESQFVEQAHRLVEDGLSNNLLHRSDDSNVVGLKVLQKSGTNNDSICRSSFIPLLKSDQTTLYLTRDVAAAIYRVDKMSLDKVIYVVDSGQRTHFLNLKTVLNGIGRPDVASKISHVNFGVIRDMKTRKGQAVLVEDMLNLGTHLAIEILKTSRNTKSSPETFSQLGRRMALSAFLVNDFKRKRTSDYFYDWEKILKPDGDGGHLLQASHARLCSLEERFFTHDVGEFLQSSNNDNRLIELLNEPEAQKLISCLVDDFAYSFQLSMDEQQPCHFVKYLFDLAHSSNAAHGKLRIDGSAHNLYCARLLLFSTARRVLAYGMRLLGVEPLPKL